MQNLEQVIIYQIFCCHRKNTGGGVLIAVHKFIPSIQLTIEYNIEAVMVELEWYLVVICTYAQPNCSTEYFHNLLTCLHSFPEDKNILVTGDYNLPFGASDIGSPEYESYGKRMLKES